MRAVHDSPLDIEELDLAELASILVRAVPAGARAGTLHGRTAFRDALVAELDCSQLEAEQLVDTLVARGFLVLEPGVSGAPGVWRVRPDAG